MPEILSKDTVLTSVKTAQDAADLPILAADETTFRKFIENLPAMFYAVTPTSPHRPIFISPTFERFGYPLEDWLTKPEIWDIVTHPEDRDEILGKTREALKRGESTDFVYRVVCLNGDVRWIRDRGCFIRDDAGEPICWQGVVLDITAQKEAEQEIHRREKLYRTLARHIPKTAVLLFDRDFRYRLADGEQLAQHGWSTEQFEGSTLSDVFSEDIVAEYADYYARALDGETISFESSNADGDFQVTIMPVRDESNEIFAGMVLWIDISERKASEAALVKSEARHRELFENANDIIYIHDLEGNYVSINDAAERIFGYTKDEALKMNMSEIAAPSGIARIREQLALKISGEITQTVYEVDCIRKDGGRVTLEVNSSIVEQDGVPVGIQGIARDITERRHAEEALRKSESNLAAAQRITHLGSWELEINNPDNADDNVVTWSDEVFRIFGYEPRSVEITSAFVYDAVRPEDRQRASEAFSEAVHDKKFFDLEATIIHPDGTAKLLHAQAETIYDENGRPVRMVGTVQDITERRASEDALIQSEARFRDLFENANDLIYTHDLEGNFTSLNRVAEIITGYSRDEALALNIADIVAPEFIDRARTMTSRKVTDTAPTTYELEIIAKDGHRVPLELSTRLIVIDGLPVGVQGLGRDITERRQAENDVRNTVSLLSSIFESTADGIIVWSLDGTIVNCNKKLREMFSLTDELVEPDAGPVLIDYVAGQMLDRSIFLANVERLHRDPLLSTVDLFELTDGRIFERYSQPHMKDGKPVGRVSCFRDITERTRAEERLRHYALHDALTELPNRVSFMNHLRHAVERADGNEFARFAVLFLDLDRFKVINDSLGHSVGDKLLVAIAERLAACVRPGDIVARLGGDEFTILLNRSGETSEVAGIAERLQAKISEPFKIDNYEVVTTASIGIVVAGQIDRTAEDFLRDADAAMYRAKETGKARYEIFDRKMHVLNMNLLQVETDLRHAVERNEFEVLYQPIVDLHTGQVDEFEALIRWRHPDHGLVGPDAFVSVAEETGLIIPIGRWILNEACRQLTEWRNLHPLPLSVSVNLSAKQLMHPTLTRQIREILAAQRLSPGQLKLEVTENTVMEHSDRSLKVLNELHSLGVVLSTDDFGTGYSSLSYLQKFPFERLKIDRSFVSAMGDDEKSELIVKTIVMLGDNLDLEVVAEGIETPMQLKKLRALGCRLGQGFLFARPVTAAEAGKILTNGIDMRTGHSVFPAHPAIIEVSDLQ